MSTRKTNHYAKFHGAKSPFDNSDRVRVGDSYRELVEFESLANEYLIRWQKRNFDRRHAYVLGSVARHTPPNIEEFYQQAVDEILTEKILKSINDDVNLGMLVVVEPFRHIYRTLGLVRSWDWTEDQKKIWLGDWMKGGTRPIERGRLFKNVASESFGDILVLNWDNPNYMSPIPLKLGLGFAAVTPLKHGHHCIGILTLGFSKKDSAIKSVDKLHRLAQTILVSLVLPASKSMEEDALVKGITRVFEPTMDKIQSRIEQEANKLHKLSEKTDGPLCEKLIAASKELVDLSGEGKRLLQTLQPNEPSSGFKQVDHEALKHIVNDLIGHLIGAKDGETGEFKGKVEKEWFKTEVEADISIPMPEEMLRSALWELLLNASKAVTDLFYQPQSSSGTSNSSGLLRRYELKRGGRPYIIIWLRKITQDGISYIVLDVYDNGIGMDSLTYDRAMEFGFSTRIAGTGVGLNITRSNVRVCGGELLLFTSLQFGVFLEPGSLKELEKGLIPANLRAGFEAYGIPLSQEVDVSTHHEEEWVVSDGTHSYTVVLEDGRLDVYHTDADEPENYRVNARLVFGKEG